MEYKILPLLYINKGKQKIKFEKSDCLNYDIEGIKDNWLWHQYENKTITYNFFTGNLTNDSLKKNNSIIYRKGSKDYDISNIVHVADLNNDGIMDIIAAPTGWYIPRLEIYRGMYIRKNVRLIIIIIIVIGLILLNNFANKDLSKRNLGKSEGYLVSNIPYFCCPQCGKSFLKETNIKGWKIAMLYPAREYNITGTLVCNNCNFIFSAYDIYYGKYDKME